MRSFFICVILLVASITAIDNPERGSNPEPGGNLEAANNPEAGPSNQAESIIEAGPSNQAESIIEAGGNSNPEAGSNTGGEYFRYNKNVKIRKDDFYRNDEGKIRPADPSKKEKPKGLSVFDSLETGALVFHLN